jgi:hypothetical protein
MTPQKRRTPKKPTPKKKPTSRRPPKREQTHFSLAREPSPEVEIVYENIPADSTVQLNPTPGVNPHVIDLVGDETEVCEVAPPPPPQPGPSHARVRQEELPDFFEVLPVPDFIEVPTIPEQDARVSSSSSSPSRNAISREVSLGLSDTPYLSSGEEEDFKIVSQAPNGCFRKPKVTTDYHCKTQKRIRGITWFTYSHPTPEIPKITNSCNIDGFLTFLKIANNYHVLDPVMWGPNAFSKVLRHSSKTSFLGNQAETVIRQIMDLLITHSPLEYIEPPIPVEIKAAESLAKYRWMRIMGRPERYTPSPDESGKVRPPEVDCIGSFTEHVMDPLAPCSKFFRMWDCKCESTPISLPYHYIIVNSERTLHYFNKPRPNLFEVKGFEELGKCTHCKGKQSPYYRNGGIYVPPQTWFFEIRTTHRPPADFPDQLHPVIIVGGVRFYKTFSILTKIIDPHDPYSICHQASVFYAYDKAYFYDSVLDGGAFQIRRPPSEYITESVIYIRLPDSLDPDVRPLLDVSDRLPNPYSKDPDDKGKGKGKGKGKRSAPSQPNPSPAKRNA